MATCESRERSDVLHTAGIIAAALACLNSLPGAVAQTLRLTDAPLEALLGLNTTLLGSSLALGLPVRGHTAVLGTPSYGDIRAGTLAFAELTRDTCAITRVAGVPPAAWKARGQPWLAVVDASLAATSCGCLETLVIMLQAPGCLAVGVLLLGPAMRSDGNSSDSYIKDAGAASWAAWPLGLPEQLPTSSAGGRANVVLPSLWVSGQAAAELSEFLRHGDVSMGMHGIVAELTWGGLAYDHNKRSSSGLLNATDFRGATGFDSIANVYFEIWTDPLDGAALTIAKRIAGALRPLRQHIRLYNRLHLELRADAVEDADVHCIEPTDFSLDPGFLFGAAHSFGGNRGVPALVCLRGAPSAAESSMRLQASFNVRSRNLRCALREMVRQRCLRRWILRRSWQQSASGADEAGGDAELHLGAGAREAAADAALWEYFERVLTNCVGVGSQESENENAQTLEVAEERCSHREMSLLGFDAAAVVACSRSEEAIRSLLEEALQSPQPGSGALELRISGWRYAGPTDPDALFAAVCSALQLAASASPQHVAKLHPSLPAACVDAWHWTAPVGIASPVRLWPYGMLALVVSSLLPILGPLVCRLFGCWLCGCCCCQRSYGRSSSGFRADCSSPGSSGLVAHHRVAAPQSEGGLGLGCSDELSSDMGFVPELGPRPRELGRRVRTPIYEDG